MENAHALVVGIANYQKINPLPEIVLKDARDIFNALTAPELGGYPNDPSRVKLLEENDATRDGLMRELEELAGRVDKNSVVFIYFSCHGGRVPTGEGAGEYLLPIDVDATSPDRIATTAISGKEMTDALKDIKSKKATIVFDCCHSAGIGVEKAVEVEGVKIGTPGEYLERLSSGRGWAIMASSRDSEVSYIEAAAENSLFTKHFLDGLRGGAAGGDEYIKVFNLFEYLQPRVSEARKTQHPVFKCNLETNFPVALHRGGTKGIVAADSQGFRFDAYINYRDQSADADWVEKTLVPRLHKAGLKVAVPGDREVIPPGVPIILGSERAIEQSKRTLVILSDTSLEDQKTELDGLMGLHNNFRNGTYGLIPVLIPPIQKNRIPLRFDVLQGIDFSRPDRVDAEMDKLIRSLESAVPVY